MLEKLPINFELKSLFNYRKLNQNYFMKNTNLPEEKISRENFLKRILKRENSKYGNFASKCQNCSTKILGGARLL